MNMGSLGDRLRQARTNAKLTQSELASRVGVTNGLISSIEVGRGDPSLRLLCAIADELHVTLDWLALGRDPAQLTSNRSFEQVSAIRAIDSLTPNELDLAITILKAIVFHRPSERSVGNPDLRQEAHLATRDEGTKR